jgi:CheY-like chemotaxis protein
VAILMVIDDEEVVRTTTVRILQHLGHQVLSAADGSEGLALLEDAVGEVDLIFLDLTMPGLSGQEVLVRVRQSYPRVRVVIFTGHQATPEDYPDADAVLQKPFDMRLLTETVRLQLAGERGEH